MQKRKWLPITVILLVALILRLYQINQPYIDAFSWRQSSTAMMAENFYKGNKNIFYPEVNWTGPGHNYQGREFQTVSYLAALLYNFFGVQDWVGRIIGVFFGIWGIFSLYQLVKRIWDVENALASAAVMALLPASIFIERSFLPDPAMVALVTSSLWFLVAYLQTERTSYLILAAIFGCLGFLTKLPGLLVGLPMLYAVISILKSKSQLAGKRIVLLSLVALAVMLPVIAYYLWARHLSLTHPPYHFAGSGNWLWDQGLKSWLKHKYFLRDLKSVGLYWLWDVPVTGFLLIGLFLPPVYNKSINGSQTKNEVPWFFHFWLAGCVFYYFIGAKELIGNAWNFHIFSPAVSVFAARAIVVVSKYNAISSTVKYLRAAGIYFVIFISGYFLLREYLYTSNNAAYSYSLGLALNKISKPGDLVVTIAQDMGDPVSIYYSHRKGWVFPPAKEWAPKKLPEKEEDVIKDLEDLRIQGAKWFGITTNHYEDIQSEHKVFLNHLISRYSIVQHNPEFVIFKL
jgi:4-amino-4-deoxy-L-arabinose transferase-like glycosyltransferase